MDVDAMTVFLYCYEEREKIHNFYEQLTGARFTSSYTRIGGQTRDVPQQMLKEVLAFCDQAEKTVDETEALLLKNKIFIDRLQGVGIIPRERPFPGALPEPTCAPAASSATCARPIPTWATNSTNSMSRSANTETATTVSPSALRKCASPCASSARWPPPCRRAHQRGGQEGTLPPKEKVLTDMESLIRQFMTTTMGVNAPAGQVYFAAENPKGELGFFLDSKGGGLPNRLRMRSPSFCNLSILPELLPGHLVSDVPAILGSFDFVMGECDR